MTVKSAMPEYHAWRAMISRCHNFRDPRYASYGGRGIEVCDHWFNSFDAFLQDVGTRPAANYSIDRKDNNGNYTPENCKWSTSAEQAQNRRLKAHTKNNTSGILGVSFEAQQDKWAAYCSKDSQKVSLYRGKDFFEACCARKSWEVRRSL